MITSQRLWFGLIAAPAAWLIELLFGWWVGARICTSMSIPAVRMTAGIFSVAMLAIAGTALFTGVHNWREATATERAAADRVEFMAFGGVLVSAAFVIAIVWSGLSAAVINVCGGMR